MLSGEDVYQLGLTIYDAIYAIYASPDPSIPYVADAILTASPPHRAPEPMTEIWPLASRSPTASSWAATARPLQQ